MLNLTLNVNLFVLSRPILHVRNVKKENLFRKTTKTHIASLALDKTAAKFSQTRF
jgi:hypothetical protein